MADHRKAIRYPSENPKLRMKLAITENQVRFTTFWRNSLCVSSSLSTIASSLSMILMSIRFCTVSVSTLCTLLSEVLTSLERYRIFFIYTLLSNTTMGTMPTMTSESILSSKKR